MWALVPAGRRESRGRPAARCTRPVPAGSAERARLTPAPLPGAAGSHLRAAHLPRLAASGPLGEVPARQCRAYAVDSGMTAGAGTSSGLR
ncbi:hypothetical protein [Nonomuraea gerenzanensis]|uniref:hypothetical protein n=1 Tax=Nonomuraea gerenzanensis TaxID=93944 RepID=UPI001CD9D9FE|nr:hypothetical protein [Nonomuraea gerenzanensis]UBU17449.1 hypothetical protein LCN96_21205 [Nonomuraea gerenzanensis]